MSMVYSAMEASREAQLAERVSSVAWLVSRGEDFKANGIVGVDPRATFSIATYWIPACGPHETIDSLLPGVWSRLLVWLHVRRRTRAAAEVEAAEQREEEGNREGKRGPFEHPYSPEVRRLIQSDATPNAAGSVAEVVVDKLADLLFARAEGTFGRVELLLVRACVGVLGRPPGVIIVALREGTEAEKEIRFDVGDAPRRDSLREFAVGDIRARQLVDRDQRAGVHNGRVAQVPRLPDGVAQRRCRIQLPRLDVDKVLLLSQLVRVHLSGVERAAGREL